MSGFQTVVNTVPAPAVAGDFATANPRYSVIAGPGGLVAGPAGLYVARAAWLAPPLDPNDTCQKANNFGSGPIAGIVPREQQGLITQYLQESGMFIPAGFEITLMSGADLWVVNDGATSAEVGEYAYASYADGKFSFAASGAPGTASGSASSIAANATSTWNGSIADNILTVADTLVGTVHAGEAVSGTGVASGTKITGQVLPLADGEVLNGLGRYYVNIPNQTVALTAMTGAYGVLTVGGTVAGAFGVGDTLSGSGVDTGTTITELGTGTGGAGTYIVDSATVVASTAITAGTSVQTKWIARSAGLPGELIKISSHPQG